MSGAIRVLLPPTAADLASVVLEAGCVPVVDATGSRLPHVPEGAWVRTRPGRPAPGSGPVILAELGAPVPDRPTWLETSVPRAVPSGFEGLVLKGREAGGLCGEEDGLIALASCPEPDRVILDAGVGPDTAAAVAALGGAGVLLVETHLACPELQLPEALARRLTLPSDELTHERSGLRFANSPTAPVLRQALAGEDIWSLADGIWETGDPSAHLWLMGHGLALARELAERHGNLRDLLQAYSQAWERWAESARRARPVPAGRTTGHPDDLVHPGVAAQTGGTLGSAVLWQQAVWWDRPVQGGPLLARLATGGSVVAEDSEVQRALETLPEPAAPPPQPEPKEVPKAPRAPAAPISRAEGPEPVPAVAIIGIGCRFPGGSDSPEAFWENIVQGKSAIGEVPPDRWDQALFYDPDPQAPDRTYTRIGAFLTEFTFDSKRFRIPPRVARQVDPVQQITLACVADALADAGLMVDKRSPGRPFDRERCAVILGNSLGGEVSDAYAIRLNWPAVAKALTSTPQLAALSEPERQSALEKTREAYLQGLPEIDEDSMPGELANVIAGRIANAFDLGGANYTVDAACASSMAALQNAVGSLQRGDSDLVVTGGADRSMNIATYVKFCKIGALSPDHSAPFDASANGFVMGEGAGILVLKRLEDAERDGDRIYAVIRGIGASSDGKGKGITAPNIQGQLRALRRAYQAAGIEPWQVDLIEAHGTSTVVGDQVEIQALNQLIGEGHRGDRGPVRVGSVKSMIGHLKSAAGAASCIKAALALHHGVLPPSINYRTPRPDTPLDVVPLQIQTQPEPWPESPEGLRRAGVSAFGFGGTNFHIVMESWAGQTLPHSTQAAPPTPQTLRTPRHPAPAAPRPPAPPRPQLPDGIWATSALDPDELLSHLRDLREGCPAPWHPSAPVRIAAAARDEDERKDQLDRAIRILSKGTNPDMLRARAIHYEDAPFDGRLALLFTGQGSQYLDMGLDLAAAYPIVAETLAEADRILTPTLGRPITEIIALRPGEDAAAKRDALRQTEYSQPATLALDVAILRLLSGYGVHPDMVAGHSLGEYGAAVAAGIMTFDQALHAVSARGREMANIRLDDPGKMAGIAASTDAVEAVLAEVDGYVIAANKNCPSQTVIAGASDAVDEACERFRARGVTVHPLEVSHAFHSQIVSPASEPLRGVLTRLGLRAPVRPITTNVSGEYYPTGEGAVEQIIDLLARQISAPVEWVAQMERMYQDGARTFVECGPKRALAGFTVSILKRRPHRALYTNHPKRGGVASFRDSLAGLLAAGFPVRPQPTARPDLFAAPPPRQATTQAVAAYTELHRTRSEPTPDLREGILRIVAKTTGYEQSELALDDELEADLGIDTVKQAEVFSVVRSTYQIPADPDFSFAQHRTLRSLIDWAAQRTGATRIAVDADTRPSVASTTPATSDEAVTAFLAQAAKAGMEGLDGARFAEAVLPAVQGLLSAAFEAARQANPPPAEAFTRPATRARPSEAHRSASAPAQSLTTTLPGAPHPVDGLRRVVCSGASVGLPGGEGVFAPSNLLSILSGENRIDPLGARAEGFLQLGLVRLLKDARTGQGSFLPVEEIDQVIRLAGVRTAFDLREWGVSENLLAALDITTQLAVAAAIEALRDAGIPLVRTYHRTASGKSVPKGWQLPEALRDGTGILFASAFPGYDRLVEKLSANGADENGHFDRRILFQILSMGHSQLAQILGARGPNAAVNAACASTTQAITMAADWIKLGRCERVLVVGADDVTNERLMPWIGGGFMAAGAATTADRVEEAALPFDRRRHGMILGMGAVGLVIESEQGCRDRGVVPISEYLGGTLVNSAFHGTRLDQEHISTSMDRLIGGICDAEGVSRADLAQSAVFMSHETYTPARGGSAGAEIAALRRAFGETASQIVIANTKGFTGHPMGAGIEDAVVLKSLQYGMIPPVANLSEPDPELGELNLSRGVQRRVRYGIRLAAGFGSQLALTAWRAVATDDDRVSDPALRASWLRQITGFRATAEFIEDRTLRAREAEQDALLAIVPEISPAQARIGIPDTDPAPASSKPLPSSAAPAPSQAPSKGSDEVLQELIALIAARTGYQPDELEPDFELEADLGIDTVKQAEILSELTERYGLSRDEDFRMADYPTVEALAGYLSGMIGATDLPSAAAPPSSPAPVAPAPVAGPPVPAAEPRRAASASVDASRTYDELVTMIAEKTGYQPDELEADFELEADLGIDTVKQAEILSELTDRYGLQPDDDFRMADHPTLQALADYLAGRLGDAPVAASGPASPQPPAASASPAPSVDGARIYDELVELIAEKTGYQPDELEPDFELEADLGIDTVKQAEVFSELTERYGLQPDDDFRMSDHPTLQALAAYLTDKVSHGSDAPDLMATPSMAPHLSTAHRASDQPSMTDETPLFAPDRGGSTDTYADLIEIVAERTGYTPDELEPDFELEADLGVDTVKQAEILSVLQDRYGLPPDEDFRLSDHPTLTALAAYLHQRQSAGLHPDETSSSDAPPDATEPSPTAPPPEATDLKGAAQPSAQATSDRPPEHELPGSFRIRRPILVEQPSESDEGLTHRRVRILGDGPLVEAVQREIDRRGGSTVGPFDTVIDLGDDVGDSFALARSMDRSRPRNWITLTRLGGLGGIYPLSQGFSDGARAGFTKALGREWTDCEAKVVDLPSPASHEEAARVVCDELVAGRVDEVFIREGVRQIVQYELVRRPEPGTLTGSPVTLITGGGRGICAQIALELARRSDLKLALVGRGPMPDAPLDEPAEKRRIQAELKASGQRVTPAKVEKKLQPLRRGEELRANVEALRALGREVVYFRADLGRPADIPQLVEQVENTLGPIAIVIHGAGVEESRLVGDKDDDAFRRVFDGKALGGRALVDAISPDAFFLSMGSVAGRFGNPGQVDYAAANDALARICLTRPHALHVDWTAWGDVGMAARGGMRHLLEQRGVDLLPAAAGAALVADLLAARITGEIVVAGRLGDFFPSPPHPLLDRVEMDGDVVRAFRELSVDSDPWIRDHAIDDTPVLPGVVGLELMAAAAQLVHPGLTYAGARNVRFDAPIKVHGDRKVTLLIEAEPTARPDEVLARLVSVRTLRTGRTRHTEHFRATILLGETRDIDSLPSAFLPDETLNSEEIYRRFFHGPIFQVLSGVLGVSSDGMIAEGVVRPERLSSGLLTGPLTLEAAFQAAGLHRMVEANQMGLPMEIEEVLLVQPASSGEVFSLMVQLDGEGLYHIDIDGVQGPLLRVRGFAMVDRGPTPEGLRFSAPEGGRPTCFPARPSTRASRTATVARAEAPERWLTPEELQILRARGTSKRITDRIAGRVAAKKALSHLTGVHPHALRVDRAPSGEPIARVPGQPDVRVSISHHDGLGVAVAVRGARIGVDLEEVQPRPASFSATWMHKDEIALAGGDPLKETLIWSVKEAVLKVLGVGMAVSPHGVRVTELGRGHAAVTLLGEAQTRHQALGGGALSIRWTALHMTPTGASPRMAQTPMDPELPGVGAQVLVEARMAA